MIENLDAATAKLDVVQPNHGRLISDLGNPVIVWSSQWIPAFTGMMVGASTTAMSMASFPLSRESISTNIPAEIPIALIAKLQIQESLLFVINHIVKLNISRER